MSNDTRPAERTGTTPRELFTRAEADELLGLIEAARERAAELQSLRDAATASDDPVPFIDPRRAAHAAVMASHREIDAWIINRTAYTLDDVAEFAGEVVAKRRDVPRLDSAVTEVQP